jgi:hypothetical protein
MPWTVIWPQEVELRLNLIWLRAPDHLAVEDAANRIQTQLETQPDIAGTALTDSLRRIDDRPLQVLYLVSKDDRIVRVVGVAYLP